MIYTDQTKLAHKVLNELNNRGLSQASIGGGWSRGILAGQKIKDIDISYVGNLTYEEGKKIFQEVLDELNIEDPLWREADVWNIQQEFHEITNIEDNFKYFFITSVDRTYFSYDGKFHDLTGFGFSDAKGGIMRLNDYEKNDFNYPKSKIVYICLEGCRRIIKLGWPPTERSEELISNGTKYWYEISEKSKDYFINGLTKKFDKSEYLIARDIYKKYGWDEIASAIESIS